MDAELDTLFALEEISRIGTGEFTDSLIWEQWTPLSNYLVSRFARQQRAVLELKTKTTAIDHLARLEHNRKTIIAWSLNTPRVIKDVERGTATLEARLRAAATCQRWNYPLAFHFDPMVIYQGCEQEYESVVDRLFERVDASHIVWISLGSFRYIPSLKSIIQRRFAHTKMVYGEFIPGLDGKMRYFQPLRTKLYQSVARRIQKRAPDVTIYFCMEDPSVWQDVLGTVPQGDAGLARMLNESAHRICGLRLD
jgi:spore photoproduct lyase